MMRRSIATVVFAIFAIVAFAGCQGLGGEPNIVATVPANASASIASGSMGSQADIASVMTLGAQLWEANCARCHGRMGGGAAENGTPLPNLTELPEARILASVQNGVRDVMPAFADELSAEELEAVATYARMLSIAITRDPSLAQNDGGAAADGTAPVPAVVATQEVELPEVVGQITGVVTNGTAGASVPAGLPLELHILLTDFSEEVAQSTANADGTFVFTDVPLRHQYRYVVTANHGDLMFASEIVQGAVDATEMALPLTIYESGASADSIVIEGISAQLIVQDGVLQVIQILSAVNTSDHVYFQVSDEGSTGTSVQLNAPTGAQFQTAMGQQYVISDDGTQIADVEPLIPGDSRLMHIRFSMPYTDGMTFDQVFDYPVNGRTDILLVNTGLTLTSSTLTASDPVVSQGMTMARYTGEGTQPAGASLSFGLSGTPALPAAESASAAPAAAAAVTDIRPLAYILIGAGVSALIFALVITLRDRQTRGASSKRSVGDLLEEIARLDLQHKAGEINERDYARQRAALKSQLSTMMKTQQSST